ncbi:hypothetical protein [Roseobacter sinensis]|uniref:Flagellar FliJ protein n=1 Tax=Roseobacter sinensis TaxID=2931391 RepID=A0ABT3B9Q5_9RHOB|nr:hypothetical protein [Roseobacter sp. WL0113]MCV3269873.1 hypothetical protein [Roseobacter sp. WL0113]
MRLEEAKTLHALADARYRARQQLFQTLLQRENAIRADLAKLEAQAKSAEQSANPTMKSIGADVIWNAWLGKSKRALNMKLALILAEKDQHIRQVKQAYGKVLASEEIVKTILQRQLEGARKVDLETAIDMSLFGNELNKS